MTEVHLASLCSEDALIGECLTRPDEALFRLLECGISPDWFTQREAVSAFGLIGEMYLKQEEISLPTVIEKAAGKKKNIPMEYLQRCIDLCPVTNINGPIERVKEMFLRRKMIDEGKLLKHSASEMEHEPAESIGQAICNLAELTATHKQLSKEEIKKMLVARYRAAASGGIAGIPLPWPTVTKKLGGLRPGCVTVFAGRGGIGKSMCCANLALFLAKQDIPVGYIPFEDGMEITWGRLAGIEGQYSTFHMEQNPTHADVSMAERWIEEVMKLPIHMESRRMTAEEIMAWAIHQKVKNKIRVLIVDAFKDIKRRGRDVKDDDEMSQTLCEIASRLDLAVWVDHHVRKDDQNKSEKQRKLTSDDVRGSGNITNDARQMFVAQNWFDDNGAQRFSFFCSKNSHGPDKWEVEMERRAHVNTWVEVQPKEQDEEGV